MGVDWRTSGAREGERGPPATVDPPATVCWVRTTNDDPAETTLEEILARHGEERLEAEEFDRTFGSLPTDDEG